MNAVVNRTGNVLSNSMAHPYRSVHDFLKHRSGTDDSRVHTYKIAQRSV
jgi:hypothetical protein